VPNGVTLMINHDSRDADLEHGSETAAAHPEEMKAAADLRVGDSVVIKGNSPGDAGRSGHRRITNLLAPDPVGWLVSGRVRERACIGSVSSTRTPDVPRAAP